MTLSLDEQNTREAALREVINTMRPLIQEDGGDIELASYDLEKGLVTIRFLGNCSSCALGDVTLEQGVKRILMKKLNWVTGVSAETTTREGDLVTPTFATSPVAPKPHSIDFKVKNT